MPKSTVAMAWVPLTRFERTSAFSCAENICPDAFEHIATGVPVAVASGAVEVEIRHLIFLKGFQNFYLIGLGDVGEMRPLWRQLIEAARNERNIVVTQTSIVFQSIKK